jgi:hypothetical protein
MLRAAFKSFTATINGTGVKSTVGTDSQTLRFVKGDAPWRMVCVGSYQDKVFDAFWLDNTPLNSLLAA